MTCGHRTHWSFRGSPWRCCDCEPATAFQATAAGFEVAAGFDELPIAGAWEPVGRIDAPAAMVTPDIPSPPANGPLCARCGRSGALPTIAGDMHLGCFRLECEDAFSVSDLKHDPNGLLKWFAAQTEAARR